MYACAIVLHFGRCFGSSFSQVLVFAFFSFGVRFLTLAASRRPNRIVDSDESDEDQSGSGDESSSTDDAMSSARRTPKKRAKMVPATPRFKKKASIRKSNGHPRRHERQENAAIIAAIDERVYDDAATDQIRIIGRVPSARVAFFDVPIVMIFWHVFVRLISFVQGHFG